MFARVTKVLTLCLLVSSYAFANQQQTQITHRFPVLNDAPDADVTIMVFSDFECPFSKRGTELEARIISEYGQRVQIVFRNYPLVSIHPNALQSAYASVCAHKKGQFKAMHGLLFSNQKSLGPDLYQRFATELQLDIAEFTACMSDRQTQEAVAFDLADAQVGLRLLGTPTYVISSIKGTKRIDGILPFEEIKKEIDSLL